MVFIHAAMDSGLYCHVLLSLEQKTEVNAQDKNGLTILMKSCHIDDEKTGCIIAAKALKSGIKRDIRDNRGRNALFHATVAGRMRIIKMILKNCDFDLNGQDKEGNTVLHLAAQQGHLRIVELITSLLCRYRISVDLTNRHGMTSLMLACRHGNLETARLLVNDCDASLTMRDNVDFKNARDWLETAIIIPPALNPFRKSIPRGIFSTRTECTERSVCFVKRNTWMQDESKTEKMVTYQPTKTSDNIVIKEPTRTYNKTVTYDPIGSSDKWITNEPAATSNKDNVRVTSVKDVKNPPTKSSIFDMTYEPKRPPFGFSSLQPSVESKYHRQLLSSRSNPSCVGYTAISNPVCVGYTAISNPACIGYTPISKPTEPSDTFLQLYALYSIQASASYRPPAKAPPPPPPPQRPLKSKDDGINGNDDPTSRRQTTRSRFQKLMNMKKAESIISRLKRGAKTSGTKNEPSRKASNTPPNTVNAPEKVHSVLKRRKSTLGTSQSDPGPITGSPNTAQPNNR